MNIGEPKEVREIEPIAVPVPGPVEVPEEQPVQPAPEESPQTPVPDGARRGGTKRSARWTAMMWS